MEGQSASLALDAESSKGKSAQQEVCNFISEFQDGEDESIQSVCDISNSAMTIEQKSEKLEAYMNGINKEYDDCQKNEKCKSKMSDEMKENSKIIQVLIKKI